MEVKHEQEVAERQKFETNVASKLENANKMKKYKYQTNIECFLLTSITKKCKNNPQKGILK